MCDLVVGGGSLMGVDIPQGLLLTFDYPPNFLLNIINAKELSNSNCTYKLKTACIDTKSAGTLKVSKNISAAFSLFFLGFSGASVSKTGCCGEKKYMMSTAIHSTVKNKVRQTIILYISKE